DRRPVLERKEDHPIDEIGLEDTVGELADQAAGQQKPEIPRAERFARPVQGSSHPANVLPAAAGKWWVRALGGRGTGVEEGGPVGLLGGLAVPQDELLHHLAS